MSVREALETALAGREVPAALLEAAFGEIADGRAAPVAVGGLLVALRAKGETAGELAAVARALRARAESVPLADPRTVDTCGTGGDGTGSFNVSTVAAFVAAGAGVPVAKHGNRAVSSRAGSADVLERLGVRVDLPVARAAAVLREVGIAFFFARRAHPAFRQLAPVREALGVRTLVNALGPLLNPAGARRQLVGVYEPRLVECLARVLAALGAERALVVHGDDGLDEITTTAATQAAWLEAGVVSALRITPEALGLARARPEDLAGGEADENARIARGVLDGEPGPRRDLVLANAGAALWVAGAAPDLGAGVALARRSVESGAAKAKLEALVRATAPDAP